MTHHNRLPGTWDRGSRVDCGRRDLSVEPELRESQEKMNGMKMKHLYVEMEECSGAV